MRVKCHAQGKFYLIGCPEGTRLVRGMDRPDGEGAEPDHLIVPLNGKEIRIPADPPELLPLLAESGNFGVSLILPDRMPVSGSARCRTAFCILGIQSLISTSPSSRYPVDRGFKEFGRWLSDKGLVQADLETYRSTSTATSHSGKRSLAGEN